MKIEITYEEGRGLENLIRDPLRPNHLVWIPF